MYGYYHRNPITCEDCGSSIKDEKSLEDHIAKGICAHAKQHRYLLATPDDPWSSTRFRAGRRQRVRQRRARQEAAGFDSSVRSDVAAILAGLHGSVIESLEKLQAIHAPKSAERAVYDLGTQWEGILMDLSSQFPDLSFGDGMVNYQL